MRLTLTATLKQEHSTMHNSQHLHRFTTSILVLALTVTASACVTTGTFDKKVAELEKLRADHDRAAAEREKDLKARIDGLQAQVSDKDKQISALTAQRDNLRKQLDDTTALAGELRSRLEKLGQNVDKLTSEKGQLDYLERLGFSGTQLKRVTYGKDRPLCTQHNEECWAKNRRASLKPKESR